MSKFVAREGRSVFPIQTRYLFPSCAHRPDDLQPSLHLNLRMGETLPAEDLLLSFAQLRLSQYRSALWIVTLTVRDTSLRKSERARKASNKETAPRSHRVTHQAGRQKVTIEPSQRGSQSLSHLRLPDGHPLANISPGRG